MGHLYSAGIRQFLTFIALENYFTESFISFLKPSRLLGEYAACAAKFVAHQAKSITRTNRTFTGTQLLLGEEKQLLKDSLS